MSFPSRLLICPFFGELPSFYPQWRSSVKTLEVYGYDVLVTQDLDDFNSRCERVLGFKSPIVPGTGKLWDFRCALGELYADEIANYDFWGHTDFDVVYGRVDRFVPKGFDIYSDEDDYIGGHWTLYKNTPVVNSFFRECPSWVENMKNTNPTGWVEFEFSKLAKQLLFVSLSKHQATRDNNGLVLMGDGTLLQHGREVMLAHFKDQKRWPL